MYFPYLRGRQYELLALKELAERHLINEKIIPIIEPVTASSTLINVVKKLLECNINVGLVVNPKVGSFINEEKKYFEECVSLYLDTIPTIIVDNDIGSEIKDIYSVFGKSLENTIFVFKKKEYIDDYVSNLDGHRAMFNLMPDEGAFRRSIRDNRVILRDAFEAKDKNADYSDGDEYFSEDHIFYKDDGYVGFADYSIVGDKFSEGGFLPYCVVIHITYLDKNNRLMIKHFKSYSNEDAKDTAKKFYEAVQRFAEWNKTARLDTFAARELERLYKEGQYPGLGTIKKLSIMNHLEIINRYLSNED